WAAMFDAAVAAEPPDSDGLSPFWLHDGPAKIERYVPAMPLSRESRQYLRLQRTLGAYRSVMGQPRQEDLIKLMGENVEWPRIDLRPPPRGWQPPPECGATRYSANSRINQRSTHARPHLGPVHDPLAARARGRP